jgi:HK97 family phage major capsid protein
MKIRELKEKKSAKIAEMEQIITAAGENGMTEDQQKQFDTVRAEVDNLQKSIAATEKVMEMQEQERQAAKPTPAVVAAPEPAVQKIPATASRWTGNLKAFKNSEDAYSAGMWLGAALGNKRAMQWCSDHGVAIEAVSQGSNNTNGGYLVPEILSSTIIELLNAYGAFRANTTVLPMTSDTLMIPRRSGGLTAYFVGDDSAITESTKTWDLVRLVAKDLGVLTRVANDLVGDAVIPIMDNLTTEMAYTLAKKEDDCAFLGDGTSTYGGITGLSQRLISTHSSTGISTGTMTYGVFRYDSGYAWSNVAMADITNTMALLPSYARVGAKFFCSPAFYHGAMLPLLASAGGVTGMEIVNGYPVNKFLGYPVVLCESIASAAAINTIFMYFGNLQQASKLGDRQQISIAASDSATVGGYSVFERNQIALRAVERFDINVHDVGVAGASAGAIVGLISHTS